jgi:hypothetical protein
MRWALKGPRGIWIREATKNTEVMTAVFGSSSPLIFQRVTLVMTDVTAHPETMTGVDKTPSEICITIHLVFVGV